MASIAVDGVVLAYGAGVACGLVARYVSVVALAVAVVIGILASGALCSLASGKDKEGIDKTASMAALVTLSSLVSLVVPSNQLRLCNDAEATPQSFVDYCIVDVVVQAALVLIVMGIAFG
jgi:hypothetical protein